MLGLNIPEGDFVIREVWELGLLIIWAVIIIKFVKFVWKSGDK